MSNIEQYCNKVLDKAKEQGGSISAVSFQQIVGAEHYRQAKTLLLTLELIERREDTKIRLTTKGLKAKNIRHARKMDKSKSSIIKWIWAFVGIIIITSIIGYHTEKIIEWIYRLLHIKI